MSVCLHPCVCLLVCLFFTKDHSHKLCVCVCVCVFHKIEKYLSFAEETVGAWIQEADNGSEEHQVKLGAHLLSLADSGVDREENAANAVKWLIRASRQGNSEATTLLDKCTKTGTGGM